MLCLDTMTLVERVHVACVVVRDERISSVSHYTLLQCMQTCMIKQNADLSTSVASSRSVVFCHAP